MPLPKALHVMTYLMVLWSFTALASTGELPLATVIAMYLGILVSFFKGKIAFTLPRWLANIVTLLVLGITVLYCVPDVTQRLLGAVIHFFFYLEFVKLCARKPRPEDYLHIIVISFFQIVATAVSTQSWVFMFVVIGFIAQACVLLVLVNARRDSDEVLKAYDGISRRAGAEESMRIKMREAVSASSFSLIPSSLMIRFASPCLLIVAVSALIFMVIPRFSANRPFLGISKPKEVQSTGFSSDVDLQNMNQIYADPTIVMRIYPEVKDSEEFSAHPVYIRATSLDYYNTRRWSKSRNFARDSQLIDREFVYPQPASRYPLREVSGRIAVENPRLNYAFAIDFPVQFQFKDRMHVIMDDEAYSLRFETPVRQQLFEYSFRSVEIRSALEVHNLLNSMSAKNLGGSDDPDEGPREPIREVQLPRGLLLTYRDYYLRLPSDRDTSQLNNRVSELAHSLINQSDSDLTNAIRLQNFLANNFQYTLDLRKLSGGDPLEAFLFVQKEGHCELFSTALAQMLRSINIPARVVSGFMTDEWNQFGNYYVVREYNAHAWVEAWIERIGWVRLDATPVGAAFTGRQQNPILASLSHYLDSFKVHWYRYVIDYDLSDQRTMVSRVHEINVGKVTLGANLTKLGEAFSKLMASVTGSETTPINSKALYLLMACLGLFMFFIGCGLWQIGFGRFARNRLGRRRLMHRDDVGFYYKILDRLRRKGINRPGSQTAGEFAFEVASAHERMALFPEVTRIYYRLRYSGGGGATTDEMQVIKVFFENLD